MHPQHSSGCVRSQREFGTSALGSLPTLDRSQHVRLTGRLPLARTAHAGPSPIDRHAALPPIIPDIRGIGNFLATDIDPKTNKRWQSIFPPSIVLPDQQRFNTFDFRHRPNLAGTLGSSTAQGSRVHQRAAG